MASSLSSSSSSSSVESPRVTNNYKKTERKPTKAGSVTSGFLGKCFPFTLAAIGTTFINSFNLISDWLAFQTLKRSNISHYVPENTTKSTVAFYNALAPVLFGLCIASACIFGLHIAWYSYMFCMRRRMFYEKRDGVPYSLSFVEQFGGEILTLIQCLIQDLPMSVLYLLLQISICCDLLFMLTHFIFVVSFAATTLSASVKIIQVVWRSGCFRQRDEYNNKCSLQILRFVTLFCFIAVLVISALNLTLASCRSLPHSFLHSNVFDKVGIDRWVAEDHIVLYQQQMTTTQEDSVKDNGTVEEEETHLISLKDIIAKESETVTVIQRCCVKEPHPSWFNQIEQSNNRNLFNCSLVYQFQYSASELTIFYNYGYKCFDTSGTCVSHFPSQSTQTQESRLHHRSRPDDDSSGSDPQTSHIQITEKQEVHWVKCSSTLRLVHNDTLLAFNPCSFSPLDQ